MLTSEIRNKIDRIWDTFWFSGISNPLEVIEQITYLLFLKRLDEQEIAEELKANREKKPMQKRFFPEGKDSRKRPYQDFRWSRFKNFDPRDMYEVVNDHIFLWLRTLGGDGTTYFTHIEGARFTIPTPALLTKVVDMIDKVRRLVPRLAISYKREMTTFTAAGCRKAVENTAKLRYRFGSTQAGTSEKIKSRCSSPLLARVGAFYPTLRSCKLCQEFKCRVPARLAVLFSLS